MKVCIRTDASAAIGAGHLMRCLALADELRRHGAQTRFVTRAVPRPWGELIAAHGHHLAALAPDFPGGAADADDTRRALGQGPCEWLVVDHYALDCDWETALRPHARRILAIDDLGRRHDCDVLLDQNVVAAGDPYGASVPAHCVRLLGPRYALLRPEFAAARKRTAGPDVSCRRILINFGGSDPSGETGKAIEAFLAAAPAEAKARVVLGAANAQRDELHRRYDGQPRLDILDHSDRMAELMADADLAIGAGGSSTWERASLGLPAVVIAVADNQTAIATDLAQRGCHCYLGRSHEVGVADIAAALAFLAQNPHLRSAFGRASAALCDGGGARRVAARLAGAAALVLRRATAADSAAIYAWRNAAEVRRYALDPAPIAAADHARWFAGVLADADRHLLVGEDEAGPVGVVRFDVAGERADISIYLVPQRIGGGLGTALLAAAHDWLATHLSVVREVRASVLPHNPRSATLFEHAGYRIAELGYRKQLP